MPRVPSYSYVAGKLLYEMFPYDVAIASIEDLIICIGVVRIYDWESVSIANANAA